MLIGRWIGAHEAQLCGFMVFFQHLSTALHMVNNYIICGTVKYVDYTLYVNIELRIDVFCYMVGEYWWGYYEHKVNTMEKFHWSQLRSNDGLVEVETLLVSVLSDSVFSGLDTFKKILYSVSWRNFFTETFLKRYFLLGCGLWAEVYSSRTRKVISERMFDLIVWESEQPSGTVRLAKVSLRFLYL